ncbi:LytR/AlgR family response regulator transcription factor [Schleiferilactobacillus shenzhenensis]|uniref:CzcR n=1 Tax=Schleiferilactobacillus shenzhenensis LY-73 TaxID=1231336 RepID=U4TI78_9LACO|nr:LytTR family DNA-binding domain-containing protein [Schleiferilactobacillus shenzhenensis]ERL64506.1 CzcR [Schleiferilactobacillus shenzhenensis LY-73]
MQIGIIEDNPAMQQTLVTMLAQHDPPQTAHLFPSGEAFLFAWPDLPSLDLVLLDIKLPGMDGMAVAKQIRTKDAKLPLAFLSNYDDYVFDGYDVNALDYILKPITAEKLTKVLARAAATERPAFLVLPLAAGPTQVYLYDIMAVTVDGHYLTVITQQGQDRFKESLTNIRGQLDDRFITTHQAAVVNIDHIRTIGADTVTLTNGAAVPLARNRAAAVKQAFWDRFRKLARK